MRLLIGMVLALAAAGECRAFAQGPAAPPAPDPPKPAVEQPGVPPAVPAPPAPMPPLGKPPKPKLETPLPPTRPLGTAGPATKGPRDPFSEEFIPMPDRWRLGWPRYDRYAPKGRLPYVESAGPLDPYNQNWLKGDYPIRGDHLFLNLNVQSLSVFNPRHVAAGEATDQFFAFQNFVTGAEVFAGDTVFEPRRWAARVTSVWNMNFLANGTLNPGELRAGVFKQSFEEAFIEKRLAVLSPSFDFLSLRAGMQNFTSDFRGFLFSDNQLGVRLFGNLNANRDQYNLAWFDMRRRDEVSQLHDGLRDRRQDVFIANWYRADLFGPGYTGMLNLHFNDDRGQLGDARQQVGYLGWHGDGRLGGWNISHAFYQALGRDGRSGISSRSESIDARMAALELSRDADWLRYRFSAFYASGDGNPKDGQARGFDAIMDNPNFAGGQFMFWDQQASTLPGLGIVSNKFSLLPSLRNKFTDRSNFVNPGLLALTAGVDLRVSPRLKLTTNLSYLRYENGGLLRQLSGDSRYDNEIGFDLGVGWKYRPFLNENVTLVGGAATLIPTGGTRRVLGGGPLYSLFAAVQFAF